MKKIKLCEISLSLLGLNDSTNNILIDKTSLFPNPCLAHSKSNKTLLFLGMQCLVVSEMGIDYRRFVPKQTYNK